MLYGMQLTHHQNVDIMDKKYFAGSTNGYTLPPGVHKC